MFQVLVVHGEITRKHGGGDFVAIGAVADEGIKEAGTAGGLGCRYQ